MRQFVRLAAKGHRVLSESASEILKRYLRQNAAVMNGHDFGTPTGPVLGRRERQVLPHITRARTTKAIAQMLGESTVKAHVLHIYEKLGVGTSLDLLSLALERGGVQGVNKADGRET